MNHRIGKLSFVVAAGALFISTAAHAAVVVPAPISVTGPEFSGDFAVTKLFDGTVADADVDVTSYGGEGQWAGPGVGPHDIFMDYGSSISADGVAYSQRLGDLAEFDKVGQIEFWFSDVDFVGVIPVSPADATVAITNLTDQVLTSYALGGTFNGRYVAARFTIGDGVQGNPGGSEMRLLIPEPASLALLGLGGLMMVRRRRA